jgi:hypothetical protein
MLVDRDKFLWLPSAIMIIGFDGWMPAAPVSFLFYGSFVCLSGSG